VAEKLDAYDILAILVPGVLVIYVVLVLFPSLAAAVRPPELPESFVFVVDLAAAIFLGHVIQTIGSLVVEPVLNRLWGGRPSETAVAEGLGERYLPKETAEAIRAKLETTSGLAGRRSLFMFAMREARGRGRVDLFNALYAYHRALLTLVLLVIASFVLSRWLGAAANWDTLSLLVAFAVVIVLLLLVERRTKQRAFYFVREVLLEAEKALDERTVRLGGSRG